MFSVIMFNCGNNTFCMEMKAMIGHLQSHKPYPKDITKNQAQQQQRMEKKRLYGQMRRVVRLAVLSLSFFFPQPHYVVQCAHSYTCTYMQAVVMYQKLMAHYYTLIMLQLWLHSITAQLCKGLEKDRIVMWQLYTHPSAL